MNAEFDQYIIDYRKKQDKIVSLSGESSSFFAAYKTQKLMSWFSHWINEPISILDFGAGDGLMTDMVQRAFHEARVVGVDPSGESVKYAQQEYPNISFVQTYNEALPFADESFDLIFAAGVFHHIPFAEHEKYLNDIRRVLKKGGAFVLFELNPLNPLSLYTFYINPMEKNSNSLVPWYGYRMLTGYCSKKIIFYCFFPKWFAWLRPLELYMAKLPVGALYAVIASK